MNPQAAKKNGRPFLFVPEGRIVAKSARLDSDTIRRLKRLGGGNLSAGIRMAAASRSFKRYHRMVDAAQSIIDAYDMEEDVGPAIDELVKAICPGR